MRGRGEGGGGGRKIDQRATELCQQCPVHCQVPTAGISDIRVSPTLFNSRSLPRSQHRSPRRTRSWWSGGRTGPRRRSASCAGHSLQPSQPSLGWTSQGWVLAVLQWPPSHGQSGRSVRLLSMWALFISTDQLGGSTRWSPGVSCPPCPPCCINIIIFIREIVNHSQCPVYCCVWGWGILQYSA